MSLKALLCSVLNECMNVGYVCLTTDSDQKPRLRMHMLCTICREVKDEIHFRVSMYVFLSVVEFFVCVAFLCFVYVRHVC